MLPHFLELQDEEYNKKTLLNLLNEGNCFDMELDHREKDALELHFNCKAGNLVYAFVFKKGKWKVTEYDSFANHDQVKHGKILRPFA